MVRWQLERSYNSFYLQKFRAGHCYQVQVHLVSVYHSYPVDLVLKQNPFLSSERDTMPADGCLTSSFLILPSTLVIERGVGGRARKENEHRTKYS